MKTDKNDLNVLIQEVLSKLSLSEHEEYLLDAYMRLAYEYGGRDSLLEYKAKLDVIWEK